MTRIGLVGGGAEMIQFLVSLVSWLHDIPGFDRDAC
jgi:hypothetical protein